VSTNRGALEETMSRGCPWDAPDERCSARFQLK